MTSTKKVSNILYNFEKKHPEMLVFPLSTGQKKINSSNAIKFYKDNGLVLIYLTGLKRKYPDDFNWWSSTPILNAHLPKIIQKGGDWLAKNKHNNFKFVAKNIGTTNEELEKIKLGTKIPVNSITEEIVKEREERRKAKHL